MSAKKVTVLIAAISLIFVFLFIFLPRPQKRPEPNTNAVQTATAPASVNTLTISNPPAHRQLRIRKRATDFSADEKAEFLANFEKRYKPAIQKWAKAYGDHIPFGPDAVTADKVVERIGADSSFNDYVFVIDGITFGVRDSRGVAEVDYLNDPTQTKKMQIVPKRAAPPISEMPLERQEISDMVLADSATQFTPDQIRMTPSGFSGGLDGGAIVHIGGNPRNGATWKFDLVFGPNGKLAYYLRGL